MPKNLKTVIELKTAIVLVILVLLVAALPPVGAQTVTANGYNIPIEKGIQSPGDSGYGLGCPGCPGCPDNPNRTPGAPGCY